MGIPGIRVKQWLERWNDAEFDRAKFQSEPPHEFYLSSIPASTLRALGTAHQRDASSMQARDTDTAIQRQLQPDRSLEISRYIQDGYPLSSIRTRELDTDQERSLRKPGWLPTAIIANIVPAGQKRGEQVVQVQDEMRVVAAESSDAFVSIELPASWTGDAATWRPGGALPIEIIDGQHRLSAFDVTDGDYDLPVVIFTGLDLSWQAYLFWTVNIKPKRINGSLAYDLYPLLRHQDWLESGETINVYRETRAQELVEVLWGDPRSVWRDRINMLGQSGMRSKRPVTQAAFIRSLTSTFVRTFSGYQGFGGLFGSATNSPGLEWPRGQQSAFLVRAWGELGDAILRSDEEWVESLRAVGDPNEEPLFEVDAPASPMQDPAFSGQLSLLASEVGVRGYHMVLNDLFFLAKDQLSLHGWQVDRTVTTSVEKQFEEAWTALDQNQVGDFLRHLTYALAKFDWRTFKAPGIPPETTEWRRALRGSGAYPILRDRLLEHLVAAAREDIAGWARTALENRA
ncbi:DGQHR domain-containing protein [Curtobacterium sp. YR515]|uniref:DGQHR domain-containing protein n=1 Tax=Curtobacterium sp. YR515 TaxID=1855316 RepID=UPI0008F297AC|nr:DGQHR domain-containing protein [Curtobacterium sp. YR515]SFF99712.1 DNA-sulfur modification-associated [Curtobacterium sp. YR515]